MLIFIHTNIPKTKKSAGMRMGKGSGSLDLWMVPVKKRKNNYWISRCPY